MQISYRKPFQEGIAYPVLSSTGEPTSWYFSKKVAEIAALMLGVTVGQGRQLFEGDADRLHVIGFSSSETRRGPR